ncbi:hypothetical protein DERF_011004 [Dermatophagoides farinae]|uniref:Uncharacterized protein n=1 Tax=Dermatophagoides farinae TaxID=6954 RepID=A0A922HU38_DERFA|nr:hypothetical protein DERF_011004 [Dermatophagoides farinae]
MHQSTMMANLLLWSKLASVGYVVETVAPIALPKRRHDFNSALVTYSLSSSIVISSLGSTSVS